LDRGKGWEEKRKIDRGARQGDARGQYPKYTGGKTKKTETII